MYFFVIIFALIYWIIYGNWIGGCLMASLFVILIYSMHQCKAEKEQLIVEPKLDDWVVTEGNDINLELKIQGITAKKNNYTFRLEYEIQANFHGYKKRRKQKLIWNPQENDTVILSERIDDSDSYCIKLCSIAWEDLTGVYKVKKNLQKRVSFLAMPKRYEMGVMNEKMARRSLLEQGFEYDGVRPYKDGDRISRVHWNLYAATGQLWVRKNEEEEQQRIRIGLSLSDIPKERISEYLAVFYSISYFLMQQGVIQEICYGDRIYKLSQVDQYEELFTSIFCEEYETSFSNGSDVYVIPLPEEGIDVEKFLYDLEL